MKRVWCVLTVALCLLVPSSSFSAAGTGKIVLVGDEWCPYNCAVKSELPGYAVEVARIIFRHAGYRVEYRVVPWNRALIETRAGRFTAVIGATFDEAPGFVFPDESVGRSANDFYARVGDSWRYTGMDSLLSRRIGAVKNYDYDSEMNAYLAQAPEGKVFFSAGSAPLSLNLKLLLAGRIDVVMDDRNVVRWHAYKAGTDDLIEFAGSDFIFADVFIAFSPKCPEARKLAKIFSSGIRRMRKSGELQTILDKYAVEDWK